MASAFGHAISAVAIGSAFSKTVSSRKFWMLGIVCSILPDADVIGFPFGIPYDSFWGHRGFSHSLFFAALVAILFAFLFYRNLTSKHRLLLILYLFFCTASHGLFDALTNGGMGIAFFSPFEDSRYFLPWRPIQVSPIGVESFFSERGWRVVSSELVWIGIPCFVFIILVRLIKRFSPGPR